MKFQHQQKGLFTFYREQQLFEQQIKRLRQQKQSERKESNQNKIIKRKSNTTVLSQNHKLSSQPNARRQDSPDRQESKCKRYGDAVAVFDRKQTQFGSSSKNRAQSPLKLEMGSYLENKNMSFEINRPSPATIYNKLKSMTKRKDKTRYSRSKPDKSRKSTKLPSIVKAQNLEEARPFQYQNMYSGSLLRSNGSDLRERHNKVLFERSSAVQSKQGISYFDFSRSYEEGAETRKKKELSLEQRKLLEMLGRYRR